MLHANVADGVHRIEDANTNWYLLEQDGRLTVVDAGVPSSWASLHEALAELGHRPSDVEAVVLTHAHFDHTVIAGDAIVTLDPYTARRGPRLVARAATVDTARNLRTLDALLETSARTVLVGHGDPWTDGIASAVAQARDAGAA